VSLPLVPSDRAPGLHVAPGTEIPDDAEIAPHVTVYAGVELGRGVVLGQGAILGRPQDIDARSRSQRQAGGESTVVGAGCRVGSHSVVVAGAHVGAGSYLGDHVLIRETARLGEQVMIGRGSNVSLHTHVGDRTRIQNNALVGPWTTLDEDVLVSPRVTFVGDPTMGRRNPGAVSAGIRVRRASRIGTASIIFPGVEIGAEAVIGAASLVRNDVPARTVVAGSPARALREVRDDELLERWREPS
jgi:UDP-2-acetamido-3-amino-2,3-dideoxy-glucuronate N-acetyltransferase